MPRHLPVLLLACVMLIGPVERVVAQPTPTGTVKDVARQNPLISDVARQDPDGLQTLLKKLEVLATGQRDSGPARSGATPTTEEAAQIDANPLLSHAYTSDRAATLALLRATNSELQRARLRDPLEPRRRIALVIGNTGDRTWGVLGTVRNDAALIADALTREGFELYEGHPWLDLDRRQMLQTIHDFSRSISPGSMALVYYAGHGVRLGGRNFLVPANAAMPANGGDYDRNLVAVDDMVLRQMQVAGGALNLIILDACEDRPVPLPAGTARAGELGNGSGFAAMAPHGSGTVVISSTGPDDIARDSVRHGADSPFADAFAAVISQPGLEVRDVFDRVSAMVERVTDHRQQPWISYSSIGRFYIGAPAKVASPAPSIEPDDGPFHCPSSGTTVTLDVTAGAVTGTYQATDPADPVLCRIVTSAGESKSLLYNLYNAGSVLSDAPIRRGMDELLSKHADQVSFEVYYNFSSRAVETWKRIGIEMLPIDGRYVRTMKFERTRKPSWGFGSLARSCDSEAPSSWLVWYDPAAHVFVKSQCETPSGTRGLGEGMSGAFTVLSVTHND